MKKLLIITQKVSDQDLPLGFFIPWIRALAERFEKVTVFCLEQGPHSLPASVRILSLGKDEGLTRLGRLWRFYRYSIALRHDYDVVFVHMNPIYVVLGGPLWRMWGKTISLWYAHGKTHGVLWMAERLAHIIFTSTSKGFRLPSRKVRVVGQGIDTELFSPALENSSNSVMRLMTAGRITPSKDYETLIKAIHIAKTAGVSLTADIIGAPALPSEHTYFKSLVDLVNHYNLKTDIAFGGLVYNRDLPTLLRKHNIFVNMSHTGSLDKAVLEAMACGLVVVTCNEALTDILGDYQPMLMYPKRNFEMLAERIISLSKLSNQERSIIGKNLREIVVRNHNLTHLIDTISSALNHYHV